MPLSSKLERTGYKAKKKVSKKSLHFGWVHLPRKQRVVCSSLYLFLAEHAIFSTQEKNLSTERDDTLWKKINRPSIIYPLNCNQQGGSKRQVGGGTAYAYILSIEIALKLHSLMCHHNNNKMHHRHNVCLVA